MLRALWRTTPRRFCGSASPRPQHSLRELSRITLRPQPNLFKLKLKTCEILNGSTKIRSFGQQRSASYQRFTANATNASSLLRRWAARPTFYLEVGGFGATIGVFYIYNLEEVPISGRRRFNFIGSEYEEQMGTEEYAQILRQYRNRILPPTDKTSVQVRRVLDRLIPASGLIDQKWDIHVIENEIPNAFVLPSGKVFVFTGILPICGGDDGLASVLGHEIAHNVAHHPAERLSQISILIGVAWLLELTVGLPGFMSSLIFDFAFHRPGSRRQESEADYIGLMMMAQSCFNPAAAVEFWSRMEEYERRSAAPPQFLSTHPSSHNRRAHLQQWLPEAIEKMNESECGPLSRVMNDFQATIQRS